MAKEKPVEKIDSEEKELEEIKEKVVAELLQEETDEEKRQKERTKEMVAKWVPKTKVGKLVKEKKLDNIDEILDKYKILEAEIVDSLINVKSDLLAIGQSKGKFGGGKRRVWRQTQKKTKEGNVPTFACLSVVGDQSGHVGLGYGRAKETLPAREKALREAKLHIGKINRGCGSFDCSCKELHSLPFKVDGKCGSCHIILTPAPKGTGLVVGDECKKILRLAGIKDIYGKSFGQTRSTINLAKACMEALQKTNKIVRIEKK